MTLSIAFPIFRSMKFIFNKDFRKFKAGDVIDIPVKPGITWIVGSNGSGKSTLMKILRQRLDSLKDILDQKRDGGTKVDQDILELKPEDVTIENANYPHQFFLDAVADDPSALWNSHSAYAYMIGGCNAVSKCSKGEKSFTMLATFLTDSKGIFGEKQIAELMEKIKTDDKFIPSPNLVVLDEIDEGMDLKSQSKLVNIINRITDMLLADVVVITHSIMVPIFAGVKEVFDMDSRSVTTIEEYMKKATGKTIKIEVENA